jgi:hypothetical protein
VKEMAISVFTVDGQEYPGVLIKSLKRSGNVLDGPNTKRNMKGEMIRDIIGTFYNYSVELDCTKMGTENYDKLYWELTDPTVTSHKVIFPFAQGNTEVFNAYVTKADDELFYMDATTRKWRGLSINFIAMEPYRRHKQ